MLRNAEDVCSICDTNNDCFDECLDKMIGWYEKHYLAAKEM